MRTLAFLLHPAVVASLAIHGGLAIAATRFGAPVTPARGTDPTTRASVEFEVLEAEVPFVACSTPAAALDTPTPAPELSDVLAALELVDVDPTPDEVPEPSLDEGAVARSPGAEVATPAVTRSTIAVRLRPRPSVPPPSLAPRAPSAARARVIAPPGPLATNRAPDYPYEARVAGAEGVAVLRVSVRADGSVASVQLRTSSGHALLDRAAEEAVRGWGFTSPKVDGTPVPMTVDVPVTFRLS